MNVPRNFTEDELYLIKETLSPGELIGLVPGLGMVLNPFYDRNATPRFEIIGPVVKKKKKKKKKRRK
jgi:hypothetical protein